MKVTVSLAQIKIQYGSPRENFEQARRAAGEAARQGSQVLLLPELWTTGYDLSRAGELARENRALLPELARLAREYGITLGGSLLLEREGKVYNTFVFQPPDGSQPVQYEKIHLFHLMEEDRWLESGSRLQTADVAGEQAGLAICYDLRFPEMFRRYALSGAALVFLSAEWPKVRIQHWQILLRARAIENQCFVAAVNAVGACAGETFGGRSALVSPWGETLLEAGEDQPDLLTATIDLSQVREVRSKIPVFQDRREDVYFSAPSASERSTNTTEVESS